MGAEKPKLLLVPAGEAEAAAVAAANTGPGAPPDFWANRVPGRKRETNHQNVEESRNHMFEL